MKSIIGVKYEPGATCPRWLKFLEQITGGDSDLIEYLQRATGYTLTGDTAEQNLFFCYGPGRNGKSVFLETVMKLSGDYGANCRPETIMIRRNDGVPNDVARLAGVRFVAINETAEGSRLNESLVKDMTGGDTMTERFLRREFYDFKPQFKLWMRGNHKPQIRGTDEGIWRRIHLIPFTQYITDEQCDPDLTDKLKAELPGILSWAVDGCRQWQDHGLNPPAAVTDATRGYRKEMDILVEFIEDRCVVGPGYGVSGSALYADYRKWADAAGETVVSQTKFGLALTERGFQKEKRGTVNYCGIGLAELREVYHRAN